MRNSILNPMFIAQVQLNSRTCPWVTAENPAMGMPRITFKSHRSSKPAAWVNWSVGGKHLRAEYEADTFDALIALVYRKHEDFWACPGANTSSEALLQVMSLLTDDPRVFESYQADYAAQLSAILAEILSMMSLSGYHITSKKQPPLLRKSMSKAVSGYKANISFKLAGRENKERTCVHFYACPFNPGHWDIRFEAPLSVENAMTFHENIIKWQSALESKLGITIRNVRSGTYLE